MQNIILLFMKERENMGIIQKFKCPSCEMSWEVFLGHGMGHALIEDVLDVFPSDIRQKILADTQGEQFPAFEFNFRPAVCWHCRKVVSIPVIDLPQSGHTYFPNCPECGTSVSVRQEDEELICPHCGKSALSAEAAGRWD